MNRYAVISQPMRGIAPEIVAEERARAEEAVRAAGYEVLPDVYDKGFDYELDDQTVVNPELWHMGAALQRLAHANAIYMAKGWADARGCRIEHAAAVEYGLTIIND